MTRIGFPVSDLRPNQFNHLEFSSRRMHKALAKENLGKAFSVDNALSAGPSTPYIENILRGLKSPDLETRQKIAQYISKHGFMAEEIKELLPSLISTLKDNDRTIKELILSALWQESIIKTIKEENKVQEVSKALIEILNNPNENGLGHIVNVAGALAPEAKELILPISFHLEKSIRAYNNSPSDDNNSRVRSVMSALNNFGKDAAIVVPTLIQCLKDCRSNDIQSHAMKLLGSIGPDARDAVPVLIPFTRNKDSYVRMYAKSALVKIGEPATEGLVEFIQKRWMIRKPFVK